jgi:hypothetical protein
MLKKQQNICSHLSNDWDKNSKYWHSVKLLSYKLEAIKNQLPQFASLFYWMLNGLGHKEVLLVQYWKLDKVFYF